MVNHAVRDAWKWYPSGGDRNEECPLDSSAGSFAVAVAVLYGTAIIIPDGRA